MDEKIEKIANELMKQKNEIIDLFCKTFFVCQDVKSVEELRYIFENFELRIRMNSNMPGDESYSIGMNAKLEMKPNSFGGFDPPPWNINDYPEKTEGWIAYQEYLRERK
jgi:hypothetical protein